MRTSESTWDHARIYDRVGVGIYHNDLRLVRVLHTADNMPILDVCESQPFSEAIKALPGIARHYAAKNTPCAGLMRPGSYQLLLLETPQVPEEELRNAVRDHIQNMSEFHANDVILDTLPVPARQEPTEPVAVDMMYVAVAPKTAVLDHVDELLNAGFSLNYLDVPEFALCHLTAHIAEDKEGMAFLWLSQDKAILMLSRQGRLYLARTVNTPHLSRLMRPDVVLNPETFSNDTKINQTISQIILEIQQALNYYRACYTNSPIKTLVVSPTPYQTPEIINYMQSVLKIKVRQFDLNEVFIYKPVLTETQECHCLPMIGAALRLETK
jgi:MSHA biogenesis protein MshI